MLDVVIFSAPVFNESKSKWEIDEKNSNGEVVKTHEYSSKKEADGYIKQEIMKNSLDGKAKAMKETKTTKEINNANMLDSALSALGPLDNMVMDEGNKDIKEMMKEQMAEIAKDWEDKKNAFANKSKQLIKEIADLYFDAKLIKKNALIAYKKEMEEADISSLLMQHEVAENAIYKLYESIKLGMAVPRTYEVLAGMQKFVLELLVAKRKFMKEMEEDLRALNDEIVLKNSTSGTDNVEGQVFVSSSQKQLITNINIMIQETRDEMQGFLDTPSKNKRLIRNTDNIQQAEEITQVEVVKDFLKTGKNGLSNFDDEDGDSPKANK